MIDDQSLPKSISLFSAAAPVEVYPDDPAVYHYTYSVDDDYTGAQIYADEARDEQRTHGMYEVSSELRNYRVYEKGTLV